jgi:hypothetical protein
MPLGKPVEKQREVAREERVEVRLSHGNRYFVETPDCREDCARGLEEPQGGTLIVVGVLLWLVNSYIPMDGKIKQILNGVVVIAVVVWLLYGFGILDGGGQIHVPKVD